MNTAKVVAITEDRNQNLWLGCFQKGIVMIPNRPVVFGFWNLSEKGYDMGDIITSIYQDSQGWKMGGFLSLMPRVRL